MLFYKFSFDRIERSPVNIAQLTWTYIIICRNRCSNPGHSTYPPWNWDFLSWLRVDWLLKERH